MQLIATLDVAEHNVKTNAVVLSYYEGPYVY
jgi:hypothetical protein